MAATQIGKLGIEALVFDGFGTLFDLESASPLFNLVFPSQGLEVLRWWRARQITYTRRCVITRQYRNLWVLMEQALDDASIYFHTPISHETRFELCSEYLKLAMFPETSNVLLALHESYKLILLSHGTQSMLDQIVTHNKLSPLLDAILSVNTVQAYKPELKAYELVTQTVSLPPNKFGYIGCNPMDIAGARAFGMKTIWLNRMPAKNILMGLISDITINNLQNSIT